MHKRFAIGASHGRLARCAVGFALRLTADFADALRATQMYADVLCTSALPGRLHALRKWGKDLHRCASHGRLARCAVGFALRLTADFADALRATQMYADVLRTSALRFTLRVEGRRSLKCALHKRGRFYASRLMWGGFTQMCFARSVGALRGRFCASLEPQMFADAQRRCTQMCAAQARCAVGFTLRD